MMNILDECNAENKELKRLFHLSELDKIFGDDIYLYYTSDPQIIIERQKCFKDLYENSNLLESIKRINSLLADLMNSYELSASTKESSLNSILTINAYINFLEEGYDEFKHYSLESEELKDFFELIKFQLKSVNFGKLKESFIKLTHNIKNVRSVTVGINLDMNLRPTEVGLVSINATPYRSGNFFDKLFSDSFNEPKDFECLAPLSELGKALSRDDVTSINYRLNNTLDKIITKEFKGLSIDIKEYLSSACRSFFRYKSYFSFCIKGVDFFGKLKERGLPVSLPKISEDIFSVEKLYNYRIVTVKGKKDTVANDIHFDKNTHVFVLTGQNSGGKTVYLEAVVFNQLLFQLGYPVIAERAKMIPFENIYVYSATDAEDKNLCGRFENEAKWFSERIKRCGERDIFIMDELFSGTNATEGSEVAFSALKMIIARDARGIFSTHLHELAKRIEINDNFGFDNLCISRLYTVTRGIPQGYESKAVKIAKKYGIEFDE